MREYVGRLSKETLDALSKFFEPRQVQWKPQSTNRDKTKALATAYIDARDVMNRLDRVAGGEWSFDWDMMPGGEVRGALTVYGVTRCDVGERGSGDFGNTLKAAVSDALKRCAVHFGVGRYLYYLPAQWVTYDQDHKRLSETPRLPDWAHPGKEPSIADPPEPARAEEETTPEAEPPTKGAPVHWIDAVDAQGRPVRNRFWGWTGSLGLTNKEVHEALGCESVKDYVGTMEQAKALIDLYVEVKAKGETGDADEVPEESLPF